MLTWDNDNLNFVAASIVLIGTPIALIHLIVVNFRSAKTQPEFVSRPTKQSRKSATPTPRENRVLPEKSTKLRIEPGPTAHGIAKELPPNHVKLRFIAIDVETANIDRGSICQIGVALVFADNQIQVWSTLVDPQDDFDAFNVRLHGIDADAVADAPTFDQVFKALQPLLVNNTLVQHSQFDKQALTRACELYELEMPAFTWIDSVRVARTAFPELKENGGHGLKNLKRHLDLEFNHHDAGEDARAAAEVVIYSEMRTGLSLVEMAAAKSAKRASTAKIAANANGTFFGEMAVVTGTLSVSRTELYRVAAHAGINMQSSVTRKTTLLIIGDRERVHNQEFGPQSTKEQKARELIKKGAKIRIVNEQQFFEMVSETLST